MTKSTLTSQELGQAQSLIDKAKPGIYRLKDIYDAAWSSVPAKQVFGVRFLNAVSRQQLQRINPLDRNDQNHQQYTID